MNKARVKLVLGLLVAFVVAIQIFQPARTNPASVPSKSLDAYIHVPEDVQHALLRACGDCHSNRTHWPWYSNIAPLSWVITDDVNQGRRHMNFEDWHAQEDPTKTDKVLAGICKEVRTNGMPPFSYRLAHGDLALKPKEIELVCRWSESFQSGHVGSTAPPVSVPQ
jgi:hypothetical protein